MSGARYPRGFGFGHLFGMLFVLHHPLVAILVVAVAIAAYLYRRNR